MPIVLRTLRRAPEGAARDASTKSPSLQRGLGGAPVALGTPSTRQVTHPNTTHRMSPPPEAFRRYQSSSTPPPLPRTRAHPTSAPPRTGAPTHHGVCERCGPHTPYPDLLPPVHPLYTRDTQRASSLLKLCWTPLLPPLDSASTSKRTSGLVASAPSRVPLPPDSLRRDRPASRTLLSVHHMTHSHTVPPP